MFLGDSSSDLLGGDTPDTITTCLKIWRLTYTAVIALVVNMPLPNAQGCVLVKLVITNKSSLGDFITIDNILKILKY